MPIRRAHPALLPLLLSATGAALLLGTAVARSRLAAPPEAPAAPKAAVADGTRRADIFFTADLLGTLEPCGCVKGQLGGLPRTAARIEAAGAEGDGVLWIDAGDTLADRAKAKMPLEAQLRAKADAVGAVLAHLGVVSVPGEKDLGLAEAAFGKDLGPRALTRRLGVAGARRVEVGGVEVGLVGYSKPNAPAAEIVAAVKAAAKELAGARVRIAVLHTGLDSARAAAGGLVGSVDAIVVGHVDAPTEGDRDVALVGEGVPVFRPMSQGRDLGVLEVRVPPRAGEGVVLVHGRAAREEEVRLLTSRIDRMRERADAARATGDAESAGMLDGRVRDLEARRAKAQEATTPWPAESAAFTWRFVPISESLPEAAWARAIVGRYDRRLSEVNLAWSKAHGEACPSPEKGEAKYVGDAACARCHAAAAGFWKTTRHAAAWATLVHDGKQYDLECVGCHVTGWQLPGGVCRLDRLPPNGEGAVAREGAHRLGPALENVQCEACHGPGSRHVAATSAAARRATIRREVPAGVCRNCHFGEHSPHFEYDAYLPKILGPGHAGS